MLKKIIPSLLFFFCFYNAYNQSTQNWHWKDFSTDSVHGISLHKAYQLLGQYHLKSSPIIVAVLDGGVDSNHQDLQKLLWTNTREIPGNNIDDDHNGYVDDLHGWNFLGGKDGSNMDKAPAEKTRIYHQYKKVFESQNLDTNAFNPTQKKQYQTWKQTAAELSFSEEDAANLQYLKMALKAIKKLGDHIIKEMNDSNFTVTQLEPFQPLSRVTLEAKMAYLRTIVMLGIDKESKYTEVIGDLSEYIAGKEIESTAKETEPEPIRANIIKDNYNSLADNHYGNNNITGPNARHGTHVAGLIASIPDRSWNVSELYPAIKIMSVRVVPDGDEYDKDIALGIRYAVDNGAKVINMSFGKSFSPEQAWVDSAIRYAGQKDVLIVHSAGNELYNLDEKSVYPNPYSSTFQDTANNIITIGASSDPIIDGSLLTDFSNYGPKVVDLLSPGEKIYSTLPTLQNHGYLSGTSMAAPIVSHIAAMIRSYFPQLTAIQVKEILLRSAWKPTDSNTTFPIPHKETSKTLAEMAAIGGIVNAANAIEMAKNYVPTKTNKPKKENKIKN
jgi:subtilisin family serine protease